MRVTNNCMVNLVRGMSTEALLGFLHRIGEVSLRFDPAEEGFTDIDVTFYGEFSFDESVLRVWGFNLRDALEEASEQVLRSAGESAKGVEEIFAHVTRPPLQT